MRYMMRKYEYDGLQDIVDRRTLLQLQKLGIITLVFRTQTTFSIDNLGTHLIQELTIVANDYHGYILITQECLEPFHAFEIKVICGFIKKQNIGICVCFGCV